MARTAIIIKNRKKHNKALSEYKVGKQISHPTKLYNRCSKCGRIGGYMRRFKICRICFRELASQGKIMGVKKSSW